MSEKCFCHLNGYEVKDASARRGLEVKQDKILFFDSLDAVPADLPEGSFVAVPSTGGGGGLPVVEIASDSVITEEESAKLTACIGAPCIINTGGVYSCLANYMYMGAHAFAFTFVNFTRTIESEDGVTWSWGVV